MYNATLSRYLTGASEWTCVLCRFHFKTCGAGFRQPPEILRSNIDESGSLIDIS